MLVHMGTCYKTGWNLILLHILENMYFFFLLCDVIWVAYLLKSPYLVYLSYLYYCLFFFFLLPMTSHRMVADGSIGLGSSFSSFPTAWFGSEIFMACCGIPYVTHLCLDWICRCDLSIVLFKRKARKCVFIYDSVW